MINNSGRIIREPSRVVRESSSCNPCPRQRTHEFCFQKIDQVSGIGISGAVFQLSDSCGRTLRQQMSSMSGEVCFDGLLPGCYLLQEVSAPPGYQLDTTLHQILICANGSVLFDNSPCLPFVLRNEALISGAPTVSQIFAGNTTVSGTGNAGCVVTVLFPMGATATATVQQDNTWSVMVPGGVTLAAGNTVSAFQTCAPAAPSNTVTRLVDQAGEVRTVTGTVTPVAFDDHGLGSAFLQQFNVVVELRTNFATPAPASLRTVAVPIDSAGNGFFSIPNVPLGTYILYITRAGYLTRTMLVTVSAASSEPLVLVPPSGGPAFVLFGGDSNDDMVINGADQAILNTAFLAVYPQPRYTPFADFDASGEINSFDRSIQNSNFGRSSANYPGAFIP